MNKRKIYDDPMGQWAHPGKITRIPSKHITMEGVPYPVLGVSPTGQQKVMLPGNNYMFDHAPVTEYPIMQQGAQVKFQKSTKGNPVSTHQSMHDPSDKLTQEDVDRLMNIASMLNYPISLTKSTMDAARGDWESAGLGVIPFLGRSGPYNTVLRNLYTRAMNSGVPYRVAAPIHRNAKTALRAGSYTGNVLDFDNDFTNFVYQQGGQPVPPPTPVPQIFNMIQYNPSDSVKGPYFENDKSGPYYWYNDQGKKYTIRKAQYDLYKKQGMKTYTPPPVKPTQQKGGETKKSYEDWYKTIPSDKNDTTNYNLRRAYELALKEQLDSFVKNPDSHLYTAYPNPETGDWEFLKSKNHPTIKNELDWYYSNDPEAVNFRKNYSLDTSGEYYKYLKNKDEILKKENGGWLDAYQSGGAYTYASNPQYFDSRAVYHDNPRYNDLIRKSIYAGTHSYNPETGELARLKTPINIDPAAMEMATEAWGRKSYNDRLLSKTPAGERLRKEWVRQSNKEAFENPLMMAPGMIGLGAAGPAYGLAMGLPESAAEAARGNYGTAALIAGSSALPYANRLRKYLPKSSVAPNINPINVEFPASNYDLDELRRAYHNSDRFLTLDERRFLNENGGVGLSELYQRSNFGQGLSDYDIDNFWRTRDANNHSLIHTYDDPMVSDEDLARVIQDVQDWSNYRESDLFSGPSPWSGFEALPQKPRNKSGWTKEEAIERASKDKDKISSMSEEQFKNTVIKPTGEVVDYVPGPSLEDMTYDSNTRRLKLKDAIELSEKEYVEAFNERLDLLNDIIAQRNKSGVEYRVKGLDESGRLTFYTPPGQKAKNPLIKGGLEDVNIPEGESTWSVRLNPGQWRGNVEDIANTEYFRSIPGLEMSNTTSGVFSDHIPRRGTGAYDAINEYLKRLDLGRVKPGFNSQTDFSRGAWENFIKSGRGVGFYANPRTVYGTMKTIVPTAIGLGALSGALQEKRYGGIPGNEFYHKRLVRNKTNTTRTNIRSSLNKLFEQNKTLFGNARGLFYDPASKH